MDKLIKEIKLCRNCEAHLDPNPILSFTRLSKIIIIGQAPGRIVHETKIPWDDKSGDNLRKWLSVDKQTFYDANIFGLVPMGFCFPGTGSSGDLPPRPECAVLWHDKIMKRLKDPRLILLIGQYAHKHYLKDQANESLTETVRNYTHHLPSYFALPHPSPRNNIWMAKNRWFEQEVLPKLRDAVATILNRL